MLSKQMGNNPLQRLESEGLSGVEVGVGYTEDEMLMHQACSGSS